MPKPYEDDLRNAGRDDIAGTLTGRTPGVSVFDDSLGRGLQNVGSRFTPAAGGLGNMPNTAVPAIGGAGGSLLPMPQAQPPMGGNVLQQMQRMRPMRRL